MASFRRTLTGARQPNQQPAGRPANSGPRPCLFDVGFPLSGLQDRTYTSDLNVRARHTAAVDLMVDPPGAVNAVAVTFRADLHGAIAHTLDPWRWPASSWATSVWVLPDRLHMQPGAVLRVRYSRRLDGTPDGLSCEVVERGA